MVKIEGLKKSSVLIALYEGSHIQGMGILQARPDPITEEEAEELVSKYDYFDYLYGKVLKVRLDNDNEFDERLYDRDCGEGHAQEVIDQLRKEVEG